MSENPSLLKSPRWLFAGCFAALITTSFAFISRIILCTTPACFPADFALDGVKTGELIGAGIWPFAISIILFSLVIDRIGYKVAMFFSFACYMVYTVMAFMAYSAVHGATPDDLATAQASGYKLLYWGSVILGLGNGTVEAFANPVVATLFSKEKTKWLNILHAGWPGGLVVGGLTTIGIMGAEGFHDWRIVLGLVMVPAVVFFVMLVGANFPVNEREQAGVSYRDMLRELGVFGAFVAFALIFAQLGQVFALPLSQMLGAEQGKVLPWVSYLPWVLACLIAAGFGVYTRSFGRPLLAFLIIIMMPLATTEIGTDGWITGLMEDPMKHAGFHPAWVLVYTSAIMLVLRLFAGAIVHRISPVALLIVSAMLAVAGLFCLSKTSGAGMAVIFAAATLYGVGKTFFWPTMIGVASEQCPRGGALTMNALGGIGMLAVGILGFPFIGYLKETNAVNSLKDNAPAIVEKVSANEEKEYLLGNYKPMDAKKVEEFSKTASEADKASLAQAKDAGEFGTLAKMAIFPAFMLACYLAIFFYFKSKGGYKAISISKADEAPASEM